MKNNKIIIINIGLEILFYIIAYANICYAVYTKDWTCGIFFILLVGLIEKCSLRK